MKRDIHLNGDFSRKLKDYEMWLRAIRTLIQSSINKLVLPKIDGAVTHCQNVSGSSSLRHSGPKPNLYDNTLHFARCPMSGHGKMGLPRAVECR